LIHISDQYRKLGLYNKFLGMNLGAPRAALFLSRARRSLTPPKHRSILLSMSTVQEIEAAADLLPVEQKEELLRFLAVRLRKERQQSQPRIYSNQEVATMLAEDEADGELFRKGW